MHNMALLEKVALDYLLTLLAGEKAAGIPLPIREIAFNKLRGDEKKLAAQEAEAAAEAVAADRVAADAATAAAAAPSDAAAAPSDAAAAAAATAEAKAGGAASSARTCDRRIGPAGRPEVRHQRVSRRRGRLRRPGEPGEPAAARSKAEGHAGVPRVLRDANAASKALTERGQGIHPRRGAAQPGLQLSLPDGHRKGRGAYMWDVDGNRYIDFLQAGGPTVLGSNYAPVREKVIEVAQPMRAGDRPVPRVRAQAGRAGQPAHAHRRDAAHARLGHRGGHGRHPRGAHPHRQEEDHQGRRRLPRLERPDGLRAARPRHRALRGQGHPDAAPPRTPRSSTPTTWAPCAAC